MVVIDSTVWIDYLGGTDTAQTLWLDHELTRQRLALTDLILCEVLQGIKSTAAHRINEARKSKGVVWEKESFDRLIRSDADLEEKFQ